MVRIVKNLMIVMTNSLNVFVESEIWLRFCGSRMARCRQAMGKLRRWETTPELMRLRRETLDIVIGVLRFSLGDYGSRILLGNSGTFLNEHGMGNILGLDHRGSLMRLVTAYLLLLMGRTTEAADRLLREVDLFKLLVDGLVNKLIWSERWASCWIQDARGCDWVERLLNWMAIEGRGGRELEIGWWGRRPYTMSFGRLWPLGRSWLFDSYVCTIAEHHVRRLELLWNRNGFDL